MALNEYDRTIVLASPLMIGRIAALVVEIATYHLGNVGSTANQKAWAADAVRIPMQVAEQVSHYVYPDTNLIAVGSDLTTAQLKGAVETAINLYFVAP